MGTMKLRALVLALALSCGLTIPAAQAAHRHKTYKQKKVKMHKDKRFKDSQAVKVKPRKAPRRRS